MLVAVTALLIFMLPQDQVKVLQYTVCVHYISIKLLSQSIHNTSNFTFTNELSETATHIYSI